MGGCYMRLGTPNGGPLLGASSGIYILQNRPLSGTYIRQQPTIWHSDSPKPTTIWHLYSANRPLFGTDIRQTDRYLALIFGNPTAIWHKNDVSVANFRFPKRKLVLNGGCVSPIGLRICMERAVVLRRLLDRKGAPDSSRDDRKSKVFDA